MRFAMFVGSSVCVFLRSSASFPVRAPENFCFDGFGDFVVRCGGFVGAICEFWIAVQH